MKALFDSIASQYEFVNSLATFGLWNRWNSVLVKEALKEITAPSKILDACTGTGIIPYCICTEICKKKKQLPQIDCIDFSPCMLEQAKTKLEAFSCCNIIQADVTEIPTEPETYDCITISCGLRNLPLEKSLHEFFRVLKKNGTLFILDLTAPPSLPIRLLHSLYLSTFVTGIGFLCTHKKEPYTYLRHSIQKFPLEQVTHALQEAGFTSIIDKKFLFGSVSFIKAKKI